MANSFGDAFQKAGGEVPKAPINQGAQQNQYQNRPQGQWQSPVFPVDYLKGGYYHKVDGCEKPVLNELYVVEYAKTVKAVLANGKKLKPSQLRKYYEYSIRVRDILRTQYKDSKTVAPVRALIDNLNPLVANTVNKGNAPREFLTFIEKNLAAINTKEDYEAFTIHFQAIVAYYSEEKER